MTLSGGEFLRGLIERGDAAALAPLDREAELVVPGDPRFGGGIHRGWEGLLRFFRLVGQLFPQGLRVDIGREWRSDDGIAVEARLSGATASGGAYRNDYVFVMDVVDGRVKRITEYTDTSLAERLLVVPGSAP